MILRLFGIITTADMPEIKQLFILGYRHLRINRFIVKKGSLLFCFND